MSFNFAPKIVTDELVLCLDSANIKSYPGYDTIWTDLSKNNTTSTLVNGPTFTTSYGGELVFDGSNDHVITGYSSNPQYFTFECVFMPTNIGGTTVIVGKNSGVGDDYWMGINGNLVFSTNGSVLNSNTAPIQGIYQTVTCVISSTAKQIYVNGVLANSTSTTSVNPNGAVTLATFGTALGYFATCKIAAFKIYERALSSLEILQNYNALKSRFI